MELLRPAYCVPIVSAHVRTYEYSVLRTVRILRTVSAESWRPMAFLAWRWRETRVRGDVFLLRLDE